MDLTHWILLGVLGPHPKDEAIDAATFLALRDLRERFERGQK